MRRFITGLVLFVLMSGVVLSTIPGMTYADGNPPVPTPTTGGNPEPPPPPDD